LQIQIVCEASGKISREINVYLPNSQLEELIAFLEKLKQ